MKIFTGSLLLVLLYPLGVFFGGIRGEISALSSRTEGYQLKAVANIAIPSAETPSPAANDYPTPTSLPRNPAVVTLKMYLTASCWEACQLSWFFPALAGISG